MNRPELLMYSVLYFVQVDENGEPVPVGKPYCTICSKMVMDVEIIGFVLLHEDGIYYYDAEEYNNLSFGYS